MISTPCSSSRAFTADSVVGLGRRGDGQDAPDLLVAVADEVMDSALGLPAHDRFEVCQRIIPIANGFSGFECGLFKLVFLFAGFLPILLCQFLQLRFSGLKLEVGDHL